MEMKIDTERGVEGASVEQQKRKDQRYEEKKV